MLKVTHDLSGNYNTRHNSTNIRMYLYCVCIGRRMRLALDPAAFKLSRLRAPDTFITRCHSV
jgi:hypothetical protein